MLGDCSDLNNKLTEFFTALKLGGLEYALDTLQRQASTG
jgi:hypothetical protein